MNLPPLRLYFKYGAQKHHGEVVEHDAAIGQLCVPIVARAFLHLTNTSVEAREALIVDYTRVLADLVRHIDVSLPAVRSSFQADLDDAVSALKAGEYMAVPSPYDVIEEAGERYLVVAVQELRTIVPDAGTGEYDLTLRSDTWMESANDSAERDAEEYMQWLAQGMPNREVKTWDEDKSPIHLAARSPWHTAVEPTIRDVVRRKAVVEKYMAYLRRAEVIMNQRNKLIKRYADPRRRR